MTTPRKKSRRARTVESIKLAIRRPARLPARHRKILREFVVARFSKRTGMYIGRPNVREACLYLAAYLDAIEAHLGPDVRLYWPWQGFLQRRLKPKFKNVVWWGFYEEKYPDFDVAMKRLGRLFDEFISTK